MGVARVRQCCWYLLVLVGVCGCTALGTPRYSMSVTGGVEACSHRQFVASFQENFVGTAWGVITGVMVGLWGGAFIFLCCKRRNTRQYFAAEKNRIRRVQQEQEKEIAYWKRQHEVLDWRLHKYILCELN